MTDKTITLTIVVTTCACYNLDRPKVLIKEPGIHKFECQSCKRPSRYLPVLSTTFPEPPLPTDFNSCTLVQLLGYFDLDELETHTISPRLVQRVRSYLANLPTPQEMAQSVMVKRQKRKTKPRLSELEARLDRLVL